VSKVWFGVKGGRGPGRVRNACLNWGGSILFVEKRGGARLIGTVGEKQERPPRRRKRTKYQKQKEDGLEFHQGQNVRRGRRAPCKNPTKTRARRQKLQKSGEPKKTHH